MKIRKCRKCYRELKGRYKVCLDCNCKTLIGGYHLGKTIKKREETCSVKEANEAFEKVWSELNTIF